MTTSSGIASQVLPVSILAGSCSPTLLHQIAATDSKRRFGLLTSSSADWETMASSEAAEGTLIIEELATSSASGTHNPADVIRQITAIAKKGSLDHLLIVCHPETHPAALASLFLAQDHDGQQLRDVVRLASVVLTLDPPGVLDQLLSGRRGTAGLSPCLLAEQVEFADVIALTGEPADPDLILAHAIVSTLNPQAKLVQMQGMAAQELLETGSSFDFSVAFDGAGWRKLLEGEAGRLNEEQQVTTFVYRARHPFHPKKFWDLIQGTFPRVVRAKGFFWLATQMDVVGGLSLAGSESQYGATGEWWATQRERSGQLDIPERFQKDWVEPFGDRRQAIAFVGTDFDPKKLAAELDACLLTDSEMAEGERSWAALSDPFPQWSTEKHEHHCADHECCHH